MQKDDASPKKVLNIQTNLSPTYAPGYKPVYVQDVPDEILEFERLSKLDITDFSQNKSGDYSKVIASRQNRINADYFEEASRKKL